ncbi:DUF6428 family protein [Lewinella sp. 4G2]|uniref:DUF6428 family protein n=1 Tax=Lewinella sp. 4G2 TaxID=1803372 RepID=UPI0007B46953|nr:DUF6428 family protein [Lewinella sp. 4G2]OAV46262.1 hypothetical protein A3850_018575 [Lewinella sp. 4G2]
MLLSELKAFQPTGDTLSILLPDGTPVPAHFHVTELGEVTKRFIDCGGTLRDERTANLQLWVANDLDHRLSVAGLRKIIEMAETQLGLGNLPLEVEYQGKDTIQKFGLEARDGALQLTGKQTDCLALDACGIIPGKVKKTMVSLASSFSKAKAESTCKPGSGCC